MLRDIDTFISGINDYLDASGSDQRALDPQRRLRGQRSQGPVPRRGRRRRGSPLAVPRRTAQAARREARLERLQRPSPADQRWQPPLDRRQLPLRAGSQAPSRAASILDPGSFAGDPGDLPPCRAPRAPRSQRTQASNTLMITKRRSATGRPLMVGGPQIGYFYPGLTYEIDMHAPHLVWRGATSAPFPGYLLIGRGQDFATTLTSASGDVIDQFAEKLCGGSDERYLYKGKCRADGPLRRRRPRRQPAGEVPDDRPRPGGRLRARSTAARSRLRRSARATARTCSTCSSTGASRTDRFRGPKTFFEAASKTPQTFNSFYIDNKHIAEYTSGLLPMRSPKVDPGTADQGHRAVRVEGIPLGEGASARGRSAQREDRQLEQQRRPWIRSRR